MIASEILAKGVEQASSVPNRLSACVHWKMSVSRPNCPPRPTTNNFASSAFQRHLRHHRPCHVPRRYRVFFAAGRRQARMWIAIATTAWLLAEFFTRLRRMALPSIVLLIVFAVAVFIGASIFLGAGISPYSYPVTPMVCLASTPASLRYWLLRRCLPSC